MKRRWDSRSVSGPAMALTFALAVGGAIDASAAPRYPWLGGSPVGDSLERRIAPPPGFKRVSVPPGSFAEWLRALPLRPPHTPVRLYDGRLKWQQDKHVAVIDIDTGPRNLQQCADAIMRLRAEYLLAAGRAREIAFNYTDGKRVAYRGKADDRRAFQRYMTRIFAYAGTYSLEREMTPVSVADIRIGDIFIKGGFPGHAVLVADLAVNEQTGEKRFLLLQSFMPAQDMHILANPRSADGSPWYAPPDPKADFITPDWIFRSGWSLRRFKD